MSTPPSNSDPVIGAATNQPPCPNDIAERAYSLWLERGGLRGSPLEYWRQAEAEYSQLAEYHRPQPALEPGEAEAFWRTLVESTTDYVTLLDRDGTIRFVNHLPPGTLPVDLIDTSVYQHVRPDHQDQLRQALDLVFRTGTPWTGEVAFLLPRLNEWHWYSTRMAPIRINGQVIRASCVSTDITATKRIEAALKTSEQRFAGFMEHLPGLAWMKDLNGCYLYANEATERVFRMPRAQLYGKSDEELFSSETAAQFRENDQLALASETGIQTIEELRHADGRIHHAIVAKFPIPGPDGRPALVGGMAIDITASRHMERLLATGSAVTRVLAESGNFGEAAPRILQAICESLDWDVGVVWQVDRQVRVLRCIEVWHAVTVEVPAFERTCRERTFFPGRGLPGRVWTEGRPVWIADIRSDDNFLRMPIATAEGLRSAFAFPICNGPDFLGVLEFFNRSSQEPDQKLLETAAVIGAQISQFIERRDVERALRDRDHEFALARQIQLGLLPRVMPSWPGFAFGGAARFTQETGGDYYDFFPVGNQGLGIAIGDASGHGIGAALVMAVARSSLRTLALTQCDPGTVLALVNRRLIDDLPPDQFVTLCLARLDPVNRSLTYGSAGHCSGFVMQRDKTIRLELESTGMPLGVDLGAEFPSAPAVTLHPGELVLLLTDGILEARSPNEVPFGRERVLEVVGAHFDEPPTAICQAILSAVDAFCQPQAPPDDLTAVIITVAADN